MKTRRLVLLFSASLSLTAVAEVKWLATDYDFGVMKEVAGTKEGSVSFVNLGPEPTVITRVRPSCGCTGARYTESVIEPGDTATVYFSYNPDGRPGRFEKTVKVYMGEDSEMTVIRIHGTVIGAPETLLQDYPVEEGPLRFSSSALDMGDVRYGSSRHQFIKLYNQSTETVRPVAVNDSPALDIAFAPEEISPGDIGTMSLYLNTRDLEGPGNYDLSFKAGASDGELVDISVRTVVIPDVSTLTVEQEKNGPRCHVLPDLIDLGDVGSGKKVKFTFAISNQGRRRMNVARIFSRDRAVSIRRYPTSIEAGKKGECSGEIDPVYLPEGPFRLKVEVMTNDPLHPVRIVSISGIHSRTKK